MQKLTYKCFEEPIEKIVSDAFLHISNMLSQMSKDISVYGQEYKKLKELGRGKFGVVFRVKSHETGQDFAAKYVK